MIDTKDLMQGNWVYENTFLNKPCTILDIVGDKKVFLNEGKAYSMLNEIDPIPLTKEIIDKNNIKCTDWSVLDRFDNCPTQFAIRNKDGRIYIEHCTIDNIKYVHQLQNFLNVCKINIEFKL